MPLRAIAATGLLTIADWGAWDWASSNGHSTIGLIAGVLLVPLAVALTGCFALTILAVARNGARRAAAKRARSRQDLTKRGGGASSPPATSGARGRIAA
jgi:hypothetical protein